MPDPTALAVGQFNNLPPVPPVTNSQPKPTSVVSSNGASNIANNIKTNVIAPYDQAVNAGGLNQQQANERDAAATTDMKFLPGSGKPNPNYVAPKPETPTPTANPLETAQTNEVLHPGQTQLFNTRTGTQEWVSTPNGSIPSGYTTQDPKARTDVADSVQDADGTTVDKLSDGTYRRVDINGNYTLGTQAMFDSAKRVNDLSESLDNARKGIYTPAQQSQLDGIQSDFQRLIDKQTSLNDNTTGATTIAMARAGFGNQTIGKQQIDKTVQDGINAVTSLTRQRDDAISKMKLAFENDDVDALQSAYQIYNTSSQNIQKQLDNTQKAIATATQKEEDKIATQNRANAIKYHVDIPDNATPQEARDILNSSPIYKYEQQTKAGTADPDVTDAQVKYFKTNGVLPTFSYGTLGHAERNAFWSAIGGNPSTIIDAASNKVALKAATGAKTNIEKLKSGTEASLVNLKVGMDNVENELAKYSRTGSPFINKGLNWVSEQIAGNAQYSGLNQALSSVATEYAKIKNGSSASVSGAPVTSVEEEKKLLYAGLNDGQINEQFDVIKKDSNGRLLGYNQALDSIQSDITDLQSTNISDTTTPTSKSDSSTKTTTADSGWAGY